MRHVCPGSNTNTQVVFDFVSFLILHNPSIYMGGFVISPCKFKNMDIHVYMYVYIYMYIYIHMCIQSAAKLRTRHLAVCLIIS